MCGVLKQTVTRVQLGLSTALCGLAALATCGGGSQTADNQDRKHTIRIALHGDGLEGDRVGVTAFAQVVESLSVDRIVVEVNHGGRSCGDADGCVAAVQTGRIDVYQATVDDLAAVFPELQVLDVPYLFESDLVVERVFEGPFYTRVRDAILERTGLRLMAVSHGGGWRNIASTTYEVRDPDDARGLTFRTVDSPIQIELTRALGATPRVVPRTKVSAALTDGVIQGATTGILEIASVDPDGHFEHLTLDRHSYMMALWLMNDAAYEAFPGDVRQIVRGGFDELRRLTFAFPNEGETEALAAFEARGGHLQTPTPSERRAFVMAAGRVSTWFMEKYGSEWLVWLEEAIAAAEQVREAP